MGSQSNYYSPALFFTSKNHHLLISHCPNFCTPAMISLPYQRTLKISRRVYIMGQVTFKKDTWRFLIIDKSGLYAQIHDEVYGNNAETLRELKEIYSDKGKYQCMVLDA